MTVRFPSPVKSAANMVGMGLAELRLCKVNRKETVVLFRHANQPELRLGISGCRQGARRRASSKSRFRFLPEGEGKSIDLAPVIRYSRDADLVVDLSTGSTLYIYGKG